LKRQHTRVKYFQGSLMNAMDLERAKVGVQSGESSLTAHPVFSVFGKLGRGEGVGGT